MSVIIDGTTGVSLVQNGVITKANLPTGSVLQVVSVAYTTAQTTTNTGGNYVDTGLTASITPTSSTSKILVIACQNGVAADSNSAGVNVQLYRGATPIALLGVALTYASAYINASCSVSYLDSPATTSSTTYKTGFCRAYNTGTVRVQGNNDTSTMTLIEVAA